MITINNIDKILAINSQSIQIESYNTFTEYYRFVFHHNNIHSAHFSVHMNRKPFFDDGNAYSMKLWDGISNNPLVYNFGLHDVKDPFTLLSYLHDVINDWDNVTNK
jgi:hypothetical protein